MKYFVNSVVIVLVLSVARVGAYAQKPADTASFVFENGTIHSNQRPGKILESGIILKYSSLINIMRVVTDTHGNLYAVGNFCGNVRFANTIRTAQGFDYFLVKFDRTGHFLWYTIQSGLGNEIGYDVAIDPSGYVYTVGSFDTICTFYGIRYRTHGLSDAMLFKYDSNGNHIRTNIIAGGSGNDVARTITIDVRGDVYVGGTFSSSARIFPADTTLLSNGKTDLFLLKLSSNGIFLWVVQYGSAVDEQMKQVAIRPRQDARECVEVMWFMFGSSLTHTVCYDTRGVYLADLSR